MTKMKTIQCGLQNQVKMMSSGKLMAIMFLFLKKIIKINIYAALEYRKRGNLSPMNVKESKN